MNYGSGLRTGPTNNQSVPGHVRFDLTLQYSFDHLPVRPRLAIDIINLFDARYAYRIGNAFVGSSYAAPDRCSRAWRYRSIFRPGKPGVHSARVDYPFRWSKIRCSRRGGRGCTVRTAWTFDRRFGHHPK